MIRDAQLNDHHYRDEVVKYIREKGLKTVVDVGGAMNPWVDIVAGENLVTAFFDWNCHYISENPKIKSSPAKMFHGNVSNFDEWREILEYVEKNGKFDFAVCTQTLEDIRDPVTVCKLLPRIAKEGYIDVPSKYLELSRMREADGNVPYTEWGISSRFFGYTGHRWIMNMIDNVLWMVPKLSFVEVITPDLQYIGNQLSGQKGGFLCFWWKDDIPHNVVGNDFLGPNPIAVFNMYRECLQKGL